MEGGLLEDQACAENPMTSAAVRGTGHLVGATPSGKPAPERSTTDMGLKPTQSNAFPP